MSVRTGKKNVPLVFSAAIGLGTCYEHLSIQTRSSVSLSLCHNWNENPLSIFISFTPVKSPNEQTLFYVDKFSEIRPDGETFFQHRNPNRTKAIHFSDGLVQGFLLYFSDLASKTHIFRPFFLAERAKASMEPEIVVLAPNYNWLIDNQTAANQTAWHWGHLFKKDW